MHKKVNFFCESLKIVQTTTLFDKKQTNKQKTNKQTTRQTTIKQISKQTNKQARSFQTHRSTPYQQNPISLRTVPILSFAINIQNISPFQQEPFCTLYNMHCKMLSVHFFSLLKSIRHSHKGCTLDTRPFLYLRHC